VYPTNQTSSILVVQVEVYGAALMQVIPGKTFLMAFLGVVLAQLQ
jgi:hypothetical protein